MWNEYKEQLKHVQTGSFASDKNTEARYGVLEQYWMHKLSFRATECRVNKMTSENVKRTEHTLRNEYKRGFVSTNTYEYVLGLCKNNLQPSFSRLYGNKALLDVNHD